MQNWRTESVPGALYCEASSNPRTGIRDQRAGLTKPLQSDPVKGALITCDWVKLFKPMHCFNPAIAAQYGVTEAVIIQHFQFWIANNKRNNRNEEDGRTWTYNSVKALKETFPYMTEKQIWLALDRLVKDQVLMKGNYNKTSYDRTTWYAFTQEAFWICPEGEFHFPKMENRASRSDEPIPDTSTVSKPEGTQSPAPSGARTQSPKKKSGGQGKKKGTPGPEPDRDWQRWIDRYQVHVKKHNNDVPHHWNGAQLGALSELRKHLVNVGTPVQGGSRDDQGFNAWVYILDHWEKLNDSFLQKQFDLTVILKKITDIINRLKHGTTNRGTSTHGGGKPGHSERREQALREY